MALGMKSSGGGNLTGRMRENMSRKKYSIILGKGYKFQAMRSNLGTAGPACRCLPVQGARRALS